MNLLYYYIIKIDILYVCGSHQKVEVNMGMHSSYKRLKTVTSFCLILAMSAVLMTQHFPSSANSGIIIINKSTETQNVYGNGSLPAGGGNPDKPPNSNALVIDKGGVVRNNAYGGLSNAGAANMNSVTLLDGGSVVGSIYGGYGAIGAAGNRIEVNGGRAGQHVCGGFGAGKKADVKDNVVNIYGGTVGAVYGGRSAGARVSGNTVSISGGTVNGDIYGGYSAGAGKSTANSVVISGGSVNGDVFGGITESDIATGNTVTISGSPLIGGFIRGGAFVNPNAVGGKNADVFSGNVLNINAQKLALRGIDSFQYINFTLSSKSAKGPVVVTAANDSPTNIDKAIITIEFEGQPPSFSRGDTITLIDAAVLDGSPANAGKSITVAGYEFSILLSGTPEKDNPLRIKHGKLFAKVTSLRKHSLNDFTGISGGSGDSGGNSSSISGSGGSGGNSSNISGSGGSGVNSSGSGAVSGVNGAVSGINDTAEFNDVTPAMWFYEDVMYVSGNGLMRGVTPDEFSPDAPMTRGMVITALYRLAGEPYIGVMRRVFSDLTGYEYNYNAICWGVKNGVVQGYSDGTFMPDAPITREQMAVILARFSNAAGVSLPALRESIEFDDEGDIEGYAKESVKLLYEAGLLNGNSDNKFVPAGAATRAEFAATLHRYTRYMHI